MRLRYISYEGDSHHPYLTRWPIRFDGGKGRSPVWGLEPERGHVADDVGVGSVFMASTLLSIIMVPDAVNNAIDNNDSSMHWRISDGNDPSAGSDAFTRLAM